MSRRHVSLCPHPWHSMSLGGGGLIEMSHLGSTLTYSQLFDQLRVFVLAAVQYKIEVWSKLR